MEFKKNSLALFALSCFSGLSTTASAMTACPGLSSGGKPFLAWEALGVSVIIASVLSYIIANKSIKLKVLKLKVIYFIASIGLWLLIVYAGIQVWVYYMFTCF